MVKDKNKPLFDQRHQHVNQQTNIAGNVENVIFDSGSDKSKLIAELQYLLSDLDYATKTGIIPDETSIDVESHIKKAVVEIKKPKPKKQSVVDHIESAKKLLEGVTSATGLVTALIHAAQVVREFFL